MAFDESKDPNLMKSAKLVLLHKKNEILKLGLKRRNARLYTAEIPVPAGMEPPLFTLEFSGKGLGGDLKHRVPGLTEDRIELRKNENIRLTVTSNNGVLDVHSTRSYQAKFGRR